MKLRSTARQNQKYMPPPIFHNKLKTTDLGRAKELSTPKFKKYDGGRESSQKNIINKRDAKS